MVFSWDRNCVESAMGNIKRKNWLLIRRSLSRHARARNREIVGPVCACVWCIGPPELAPSKVHLTRIELADTLVHRLHHTLSLLYESRLPTNILKAAECQPFVMILRLRPIWQHPLKRGKRCSQQAGVGACVDGGSRTRHTGTTGSRRVMLLYRKEKG